MMWIQEIPELSVIKGRRAEVFQTKLFTAAISQETFLASAKELDVRRDDGGKDRARGQTRSAPSALYD